MAPPRLAFLSTTLGTEGSAVRSLSLESLSVAAEGARSIVVVSAFYDIPFLKRLAAVVPIARRRLVRLTVYLHGFSGSRLKTDLERLREWRSRLRRAFRAVDVYLLSCSGLFHSKLLVFERRTGATALIGSANATTAAYTENEEIMLVLEATSLPVGMSEYLRRVASKARDLDAVFEPEVRSLIAFFRTGDIYYRPNALPLFRFDLRLSDELRARLSRLTVEIPGFTATASRTYNPFAGLGEEIEAAEAEINRDEEADASSRTRIPIRPYAIQTCFGWWAPRAYHSTIDSAVDKASSKKRERLTRIRQAFLDGIEHGMVVRQAEQSFHKLADFAREYGAPLEELPSARDKRFREFLDRCRAQLQNKRWFERASRAYDRAAMPEIWFDPVSREQFEESVFDYLQYVNSASTVPLILKSLQEVTGVAKADDADDIKTKLTEVLKTTGWPDDGWLLR